MLFVYSAFYLLAKTEGKTLEWLIFDSCRCKGFQTHGGNVAVKEEDIYRGAFVVIHLLAILNGNERPAVTGSQLPTEYCRVICVMHLIWIAEIR